MFGGACRVAEDKGFGSSALSRTELHVECQIRIAVQIDISMSQEVLNKSASGIAKVVARFLAIELDVNLLEIVIL